MEKQVLKKHIINQENISKPLQGKMVTVNVRRPALGEVGNKILPSRAQNVVLKKPAVRIQESVVVRNIKNKQDPAVPLKTDKSDTLPKIKKEIKPKTAKVDVPKIEKKPIIRQESTATIINCITKNMDVQPSYSSKELYGIFDIDDLQDDHMLVPEYIKDIMSYLMTLEDKYSIKKGFLNMHSSNFRMRSVLVNWMSEVHTNFKFLTETFHLSIAIVDRYLQQNKKIGRETLQLVGTAAMLVAGKYEEMYLPSLSDFVYICDDTFSKQQILSMEADILKQLQFSFGRPLSIHFLRRYNRVAKVNPQHHVLGKYILELGLQEYDICHVKPSLQAAAACCLAISILSNISNPAKVWSAALSHYSTYSYADIKGTVVEFSAALVRAETAKHQAIRSKFATSALAKMSLNVKLKGPLIQKLASQAVILKK